MDKLRQSASLPLDRTEVKPDRPFHGGGFFRLMQFLPDKKTVRVRTYSPWLDQWLTDAQQQFELAV